MSGKKNSFQRIFGVDLRSLALFRVLVSLILLGDLIVRSTDLVAHYTDWGAIPRIAVLENWWNPGYFSLHMMSGELGYQILFFSIAFISGLCLLVGYRTRLATFLSWLLLISLHTRNPINLQGGDILLRCVLFFANFLPLGACYSIDHALSIKLPIGKEETAPSHRYLSPASAGILLQVAFMYFFTALLKSGKEWIPEGTAIEYALAIEQFTKPLGMWIRHSPQFMHWATLSTWWFEYLGPFLLFSPVLFVPLRWLGILGFWGLHLGLYNSMELGVFPFVSTVSMVPFIPSESWDALEGWLCSKLSGKVEAYYDDDCGFCKRMVLLLREFLIIRGVPFRPAQSVKQIEAAMVKENSWVVVEEKEKKHFGWSGILQVMSQSLVFRKLVPLLSWSGFSTIGDAGYRFVANRRNLIGKMVAPILPLRLEKLTIPRFWNFVALLGLILVLWTNISSIKRWHVSLPEPIEWAGNAVRLDQVWDMFAPYPLRDDGWYVIPGKLENGEQVDVLHDKEEPVSWEKPVPLSKYFSNDRWRSYFMMMWNVEFEPFRLYFGKYLCRRWNEGRGEGRRLATFEMVYMLEKILKGGVHTSPEKVLLWEHTCLDEGEPPSDSLPGAN